MITTWVVLLPDGSQLTAKTLPEAAAIMERHPGAECNPVVHYRPCPRHAGYEANNCPVCGTSVLVAVGAEGSSPPGAEGVSASQETPSALGSGIPPDCKGDT